MTRVWYACSGIAVLIALALLEAALLLRLLNNRQQGTVLRLSEPAIPEINVEKNRQRTRENSPSAIRKPLRLSKNSDWRSGRPA